MPNLRQLVFYRLLKTSTPFIRGRLILSRPLFWFVQTSPRLFAVRWSPVCPFLRQSAPRRSCLRLSLSVCLLFPSYPSLPAPAPAACACCRSRACPRLFAVRWSPACPFLRQSVPVSPSLRRLVAVTHVITPSASPQATRPAIRFCSSRATIFRPLRFPSLSLAPLPHLPQLAHSCLSLQPLPHLRLSAPFCASPPCQPRPAPGRAHQAPFYARELLKIIAVSENAPCAHGIVPRAGGCSTEGATRIARA